MYKLRFIHLKFSQIIFIFFIFINIYIYILIFIIEIMNVVLNKKKIGVGV